MEIDPQLQRRDGDPQRPFSTPTRPTMNTGPEYPEPPSHAPLNPYQSRDIHGDGTGHRHGHGDPHPSFGMGPDNQSPEAHDAPGDVKRSRACEPCRQLKVRCDPDPAHPEGSCKRCAKARRTCIVTAPTRKRQKKTDTRVAELERKIDALTATLQASHSTGVLFSGGAGQQASPSAQRDEQLASRRWLRGESKVAGSKRQHTGEVKDSSELLAPRYSRPGSPSAEQISTQSSKHWRKPVSGDSAPPKHDAGNEFADMIDRGIVDYKTASAAFDRYIHQMAPEIPFVVFPPGTTMGEVRRNKPYLFLAIIGAAIGVLNPDVQPILVNEAYRLIAEHVVVKGHKSLELVQTLMVCSIWYLPPDNFEELKFYTLTHMAAVMAIELGLNRRTSENRRALNTIRELIGKKQTGPTFDPEGPEARRTWVGCYYLSVQLTAALRRNHLVTWQPYMDECLEILANHPDALPSDRKLTWWAKLGLIMEQSGHHFSAEDSEPISTFANSKLWYNMKVFEDRLAQWREGIPQDIYTGPMVHAEHVLNLFVHGSAMCVNFNTDNNSPPHDDLHRSSVAAVIDALTTSIRCIHESIDVICSIDSDRLISLPTPTIARTTYPVVSLIKMYSLFMSPDSRIRKILDVQSLKIDYYLDKVIAHYRTAAARDGGRAAAKFGNIMVLLRNWFIKKRDQGDHGRELKEVFSNEEKPSGPQTQRSYDTPTASADPRTQMAPGMTPLHFLSEVAMGNPAHRANNSNSQHSITGQSYSSNHSPSSAVNPMTTSGPSSFVPDPPQTSWSSGASYPTTIPSSDSNQIETRGYYQPYSSAELTHNYPDLPSSASQTQGYADISTVAGMQLAPPMGMAPEVAIDPNSGDSWFNLGMMDEGLFTFPFDGNFALF
ncbi:Transcription factor [Penicillium cf. griseofulvum]|uniref:Transcription factor n=1 Tax=Penicillium cf. griseofulvum TaxID=2972120 RepID=A0A9W9T5D9_9EURO|nr:Transcription factor [Penicillium cf. griseofulvum]KAJ5421296.1 Transcription factor [Penicillium cf. griseofulvum]